MYLFIAIIYTRFLFFFYITLLAQLYLYTVHIHNASFTLYMHTLREYPRCLKVIVNRRDGRNGDDHEMWFIAKNKINGFVESSVVYKINSGTMR